MEEGRRRGGKLSLDVDDFVETCLPESLPTRVLLPPKSPPRSRSAPRASARIETINEIIITTTKLL